VYSVTKTRAPPRFYLQTFLILPVRMRYSRLRTRNGAYELKHSVASEAYALAQLTNELFARSTFSPARAYILHSYSKTRHVPHLTITITTPRPHFDSCAQDIVSLGVRKTNSDGDCNKKLTLRLRIVTCTCNDVDKCTAHP
jgi:hypothetical protein